MNYIPSPPLPQPNKLTQVDFAAVEAITKADDIDFLITDTVILIIAEVSCIDQVKVI